MNKTLLLSLAVFGAACAGVPASTAGREGPRPAWNALDLGRPRLEVRLVPVASGFEDITDLQFPPSDGDLLVVTEKEGAVRWVRLSTVREPRGSLSREPRGSLSREPRGSTGERGTLLRVAVRTRVELGLLGLAFHPRFPAVSKVYLNWNPKAGRMRTRVSEWEWKPGPTLAGERVLLEVEQPYANHNAGQLVFGPDGYLYVGLGDGGSGGDPGNRAQDPKTWLGKMLRLDVDRAEGARPEIRAIGLRNPWRYSFDPRGRLIVADVGQDDWEEVSFAQAGANLGWRHREGAHCFEPPRGCRTEGLVEPWLEYGRKDGSSLTGGYVVTDPDAGALKGLYVFGDFESGRLWAAPVPESPSGRPLDAKRFALGKFPINPSTFGRDPAGRVYVADFSGGVVYRIEAR